MNIRALRLISKPRVAVSLATAAALSLGAAASGCSDDMTPSGVSAQGGQIKVTASGEVLGLTGFAFPPPGSDDPFYVDGWAVSFTKLLVTFDNVTISTNPDTDPNDQSKVGGVVASATGPWAVDLHKAGPLTGKGGDDKSLAIAVIANQNKNGNKAFANDVKYAFGFDVVDANDSATRINVDAGDADYAEMIAKGYTVLYVGSAVFKGTSCTPAGDATLDSLPKKVDFRFGFKTRPTFINCQNPDLGTVAGTGGSPRGIFVKSNEATVAQMTMHADHPFWDANEEDAPLRFDVFALAALKKGGDAGAASAITLEDTKGVPLAPITIGATTLPNRTCSPASPPVSAQLAYDAKGASFADLYDFMADRQSTQGHLNADGLCAVKLR